MTENETKEINRKLAILKKARKKYDATKEIDMTQFASFFDDIKEEFKKKEERK